MEKNKKQDVKTTNQPPVKQFRAGGIQASIWENTNKELQVFKTVTFERSYKDKDGEWKKTGTLRIQDLPKATLVLNKAYEFCVTKQEQDETEE